MSATGTAIAENGATVLWREFSAPLRSFLRARTRSEADADDLLQDVFVRIQKSLPGLRDPAKLQGWIYRIARNAVIDHYRTRREHVPLDFDLESEDPEGRDLVDLSRSLRCFIASLPAQYREPLVRHEFQGEPLQEVATALGLTLTATKSRVRRARMMLRKMLEQCCRFEFDRLGRVIEAIPRSQDTCDASAPCDCDCESPSGPTNRRIPVDRGAVS
ncbi:MAG TPA: RNA polymerase sigma factor SigZ [Opitutaceae bacterium]|nr:RNA polymerase sigma factor SigZ [Opitutaceae bacterium]